MDLGRAPQTELGYDRRLFILAMDHRGSLEKGLFAVSGSPSEAIVERILDVKRTIYDGFHLAIQSGVPTDSAGVLVDEQYGGAIAREATSRGETVAIAVEKSSTKELEFEYGDEFGAHLEAFGVPFAKVLVRYNPDEDSQCNARQAAKLMRLGAWLQSHGRKLLLEMIVPATAAQLAAVGGDAYRYDVEVRPDLTYRAIEELRAAGVETDVWKIEGLDRRDDCERIGALIRADGRDHVGCVVLGRAADEARVDHWLRQGAGVPGYIGFAIGRTLWWDAVKQYIAGSIDRPSAVRSIATAYGRAADVYVDAASRGYE